MRTRLRWLLALGLIAATTSTAGAATAAVPFGGPAQWEAMQVVQADRQGHVYLLRTDTLEVYPVLKDGALGKPSRLGAAQALQGPVLKAAMGDGPGDWLLCTPFEVHRFIDAKERVLPPLAWQPHGVAYLRGSPVVSLIPRPAPVNGMVIRHVGEEPPAKVPALLTFDGERWSVLLEDAGPGTRTSGELVEGSARSIFGDRAGKLWASRDYAYILDRYSAAGRRILRVEAEKGEVVHRESKSITVPPEVSEADRPHFHPFLGVLKIADLTEGPDHRIYLAVQAGKGLSIDRYDPADSSLERTELGISAPGYVSLSAGRDGLYVAAPGGNQGRWRVSWEELDRATWKKVPLKGEDHPSPATRKPGSPSRVGGKATPKVSP